MASLLPLISEILPMIMPASAQVMRADQLRPAAASTLDGPVVTRSAVIDKCDKMCASVLTIRPRSSSPVRHNSEQDAIIYATSGTGIFMVKEGVEADIQRYELSQGDFAWIPAWTEHRVQNDTDTDAVWIVFQSGPHPVGAILADWGGNEVSA
ncbi:cupin domain-containing protein [Hirsutella rhossiliensis]|uniref:Cupin domain-containing protein n=1 Tax=Hirsutella rhossiliensis TaxID=111463 RepID=A0A9P8MZH9_9HYPO|nr:cupin domain-containing protein [Hirsutella rhossiliensis]KAH0964903.1 cupin domain-containing protein [Hirsutella rhossiliensis]